MNDRGWLVTSPAGVWRGAARLKARLMRLAGWRRAALATALGVLAALALPPWYAVPVLAIALPLLIWLVDASTTRRGAFIIGWWFGFGHFAVGLHWIGYPFLVDAARDGWLMPFAVAGLSAVLALFPAAAALACRSGGQRGAARVLLFAAAWTGGEWLRSHILTGFPWNLLGYVWSFSPQMSQLAAATGVLGLSLVTVFAAAAPAVLGEVEGPRRGARLTLIAAASLMLLLWVGGAWRLTTASEGEVPGVRLRLVQANIPQHLKWRPDRREANLLRYLELTAQPGWQRISHVIWPETAVPFFLADDPEHLSLVAALAPPDGALLTGAVRREGGGDRPRRAWNSFHVIDRTRGIIATYDKFHLVPFGEYLPWRELLAKLGLDKLVPGAVDFSPGPGPVTLPLPGAPEVSPLICYEAIFASRVTGKGEQPGWLLNLTNDAWFGPGAGPKQHFAMARLRALEQGLPLVRVAGTGISAVVDPYGRIVARLGLGEAGVLDVGLPKKITNTTIFSRYKEYPVVIFVILIIITSLMISRKT